MTFVAIRRSFASQLVARLRLEDSLPLDEPLLNLRVARQRARVGAHAEPLGGFPLGQREVLDAVLDHEPSGLVGELEPQVGRSPS